MKNSIPEIDKIKENLKNRGIVKVDKFYDEYQLKKIRSQFEIYFNKNKISKDKKPGLLVNKKLVKYLNFPLVISKDSVNLVTILIDFPRDQVFYLVLFCILSKFYI